MRGTDFARALRTADDALARMEPPTRLALRLRGATPPAPRARWIRAALPVGVALVLAVGFWWVERPRQEVRVVAGLQLLSKSEDLGLRVAEDGTVEVERGGCTLADGEWGESASVEAPSRVRRESSGLRILRGRAELAVSKRSRSGAPARVWVSDGVIEIFGTRFTVIQDAAGGSVTLHEGSIRFVAPDGRAIPLEPGQSLSWPLPPLRPAPTGSVPPKTAPPAAAAPKTKPPPALGMVPKPEPPPLDTDGLLDRVSTLRQQGRFDQAAAMLTQALNAPLRPDSRERLSYELGSLLTYHAADTSRACAHWAEHEQSFPNGRYEAEVQQARLALGCAAAPSGERR